MLEENPLLVETEPAPLRLGDGGRGQQKLLNAAPEEIVNQPRQTRFIGDENGGILDLQTGGRGNSNQVGQNEPPIELLKPAKGKITGDPGEIRTRMEKAVSGDRPTEMEIRVAKHLRDNEGYDVNFVDADNHYTTGESFDFKVSKPGLSQNLDVKTISGLGRNAAKTVAKGVDQVGEGGQVIVVRPSNSKFSMEQYKQSLIENFRPRKDVEIRVMDESQLPPLKRK